MSLPRHCGPCTECCTALGVEPLQKPRGVRCSNLVDGGRCGIYAARPAECKAFRCGYLEGADVPRPDTIGVVLVLSDPAKRVDLAIESRPGALADPGWIAARERRVSRNRIVVESHCDGRRELFGDAQRLADRLKREKM